MNRNRVLKPLDLIAAAQSLLGGSNRPKEARLRRAQSTLYYALFDCLARACADCLIGSTHTVRATSAWRLTYRALEHGFAKRACRDGPTIATFEIDIQDFANAFATLQERRHSADYDPHFRLTKSEVLADIELAADVIDRFGATRIGPKRSFAAHVLFKKRIG